MKNNFQSIMIRVLTLFVISFLMFACTPSIEPSVEEAPSVRDEAYPAPNVANSIGEEIKQLEETLASGNLSERERNSAEDRLVELYLIATRVFAPTPSEEEMRNALAVEQTRIAGEKIIATPLPELGILPEDSIYYEINLPRRVAVETIWQGYVQGNLTRVYSGKLLPDDRTGDSVVTNHGAIFVTSQNSDGSIENTLHVTEMEVGPLKITSVTKDGRISLVTEQRNENKTTEYYFDIPALRFVNSVDEVVLPSVDQNDAEEAYP